MRNDDDDALLAFYRGTGTDNRGRTLADIQAFPLARLEAEHDFIQWLFPLREASAFNAAAPVLTDSQVAAFRADARLRAALRRSFAVMARFYGFEVREAGASLEVARGADFDARAREWITPGNHNFLRITRILRSLAILGQPVLAAAFLAALDVVHRQHAAVIGGRTHRFWRDALAGPSVQS